MNPARTVSAASLVLCSLLLAGCGPEVLPIGEVTKAPAAFEGREVKLRGTASQMLKLPFADAKGYRLRDASGDIAVWTAAAMPADGEELIVRGRVESAMILGGESFGLAVQEIERQPPGIKWPWQ